MRRLPVYLLLDTSGSMKGEPVESVKTGVQALVSYLRQDPFALESVYLSIITFDREAKVIVPLTGIDQFQVPDITTPDSGPTHLGEALDLLCNQVDKELIKSNEDVKGDWKPLAFIMTDGSPSDLQRYREAIPEVKKRNFASIVACAAGVNAKEDVLKELSHHVVRLDTADSASFGQFFKWVSASVSVGSQSMGATGSVVLPPPPPEIHTVV